LKKAHHSSGLSVVYENEPVYYLLIFTIFAP